MVTGAASRSFVRSFQGTCTKEPSSELLDGSEISIINSLFVISFFFLVYSLLNIHRDLPVLFVSSFDYWGTFCAGVFPMPFFRCCSLDSNPDSGNANMVYQRLNDVGHPDPQLITQRLNVPIIQTIYIGQGHSS